MATPSDKVFLDTNILVYAHLTLSPFHAPALAKVQALDAASAELWISRQTLREYLAAMTRPGVLTGSIPIASLIADVRSFAVTFRMAEDSQLVTDNLLALIGSIPVAGKQVHDSNIVASMQAYGVSKLLTHNTADFARFGSVITVLPLVP